MTESKASFSAKPKTTKKVTKKVVESLGNLLKPSRLIPGLGAVLTASDIYDLGSTLYDNRKKLGTALSSPEGRKQLMSLGKKNTKELITDIVKPPQSLKKIRKKTKERMAKNKKQVFKRNKKDILKSIERKKGGKVGRPKGVGCAIKGYGKAMKRGK